MILLNGHSLDPARVVPVVSMSLTLKERETTASLVPESMSGITTESWLLDDTKPGQGIVYRVNSIKTDYGTDTPTVQLEHVIRTLQDRILFGEITPEMMGGSDGYCTARQATEYILARSDDWTLGRFDYGDVVNAYKFDGDTLLDALEEVSNTLDDCWWSYDLTVYPFRLNIISRDGGNPCEMRPGRNLIAITKTIEKSGMYTRFFPIGKDDLHLGEEYIEQNTSTYGVIEKSEVDTNRETEAELRAWAEQRLNIHAHPWVRVVADGLHLAYATGESVDDLVLGRTCRIPLEEFNTTIEEKIVELSYRDKENEPENVRVTMANEQEDIIRILAKEIKEGSGPNGSGRGGGGRGGARQQKEDHAWFEDTDEHVAMCAKGIIGVDAEGNPNWERLSEIIVDGTGIHQRVTAVQEDMVYAQASIEINENEIRSEVMRANSEEGMLRSEIVQTANMIRSEVRNTLSGFYTEIIQTASSIVIRTGDDTETYHQPTAPTGTPDHPLVDGDVWFNAEGQFTWSDAEGNSWLDDSAFNWGTLVEADVFRYDGVTGEWVQVLNSQALMQDTRFDQNNEHIQLVAGRVDVVDGKVESYRGEFEVRADQITASVNEQVAGLGSSITQTARQIRSEVHAESSQLYSEIVQTATMIYAHVADEKEGLHSEIIQTASMIRSSVSASNSQLYSAITQTASMIRLEVRNSVSSLQSSITQEANRISLVVQGTGSNAKIKPASIVSAINDGASSVVISADHIDLDGYVKATDITANFLSAKIATIPTLRGIAAIFSGNISTSGGVLATEVYVGSGGSYQALSNGISDVRIAGPTNNVYTLQYRKFNSDWQDAGTINVLSGFYHLGTRELGYMDHGNFESVGNHDWYYR